MNIPPGSAPAIHVELAIFADDTTQLGAILLCETGIETWLFHGI
jgi:hypothetical protein